LCARPPRFAFPVARPPPCKQSPRLPSAPPTAHPLCTPHHLLLWLPVRSAPLAPPPPRPHHPHRDLILYELVAAFTPRNATAPAGRRRRLAALNLQGPNSVLVVRVGFLSNLGNEVYSTCDTSCVLVRVRCACPAGGARVRLPLRAWLSSCACPRLWGSVSGPSLVAPLWLQLGPAAPQRADGLAACRCHTPVRGCESMPPSPSPPLPPSRTRCSTAPPA
jgi:hypothetical protein